MQAIEGAWIGDRREGPSGRRATWSFALDGVTLTSELEWTDDAGSHRVRSVWMVDGVAHPADDGGTCVCRVDGRTLVVTTERGGERAEVRLAVEGDLLTLEGPDAVQFHRIRSDVKQVIVYRRDLQMRKGKIAAQVAHASMKVLLARDTGPWERLEIPMDPVMAGWTRARFAKIVLSVDDEAALLRVHELALERGIPTAIVVDAGRTEFHGVPTRTTVAVGPAPSAAIDAITGPEGLVPTRLA